MELRPDFIASLLHCVCMWEKEVEGGKREGKVRLSRLRQEYRHASVGARTQTG